MTNEQLAVLLRSIYERFDDAVADARDAIAAGRPGQIERQHVVSHDTMATISFAPKLCENPEHFAEVTLPDPVVELAALDAALHSLDESIRMLTR